MIGIPRWSDPQCIHLDKVIEPQRVNSSFQPTNIGLPRLSDLSSCFLLQKTNTFMHWESSHGPCGPSYSTWKSLFQATSYCPFQKWHAHNVFSHPCQTCLVGFSSKKQKDSCIGQVPTVPNPKLLSHKEFIPRYIIIDFPHLSHLFSSFLLQNTNTFMYWARSHCPSGPSHWAWKSSFQATSYCPFQKWHAQNVFSHPCQTCLVGFSSKKQKDPCIGQVPTVPEGQVSVSQRVHAKLPHNRFPTLVRPV